jgi:3-phytase
LVPKQIFLIFLYMKKIKTLPLALFVLAACNTGPKTPEGVVRVAPAVITQPTEHDTDDPAIWINPQDPAKSLVIGTDKEAGGAIYAYDLEGKIVAKTASIERPNNVDIEYGFQLSGQAIDIAVATERLNSRLRIFRLPDLTPIDGGGLEMFQGEEGPEFRALMGIGLYKRPKDGAIFAVVGRKNGPTDGTYLWQYFLEDAGNGTVKATLVRKFGAYSGKQEIEAIAVDDALGYVYYSDEMVGIRKYYADPDKGNAELALFGTKGFTEDHEGISIYQLTDTTGYILVSDQQADCFQIFTREGKNGNPHDHRHVGTFYGSTEGSDGSDATSLPLNTTFSKGLFVAMSNNKTFHFYKWEDIAGDSLKIR